MKQPFKSSTPVPDPRHGIQPHNLEAEEGLLASLLFGDRETMDDCRSMGITPESFYKAAHQVIYEAMLKISEEGLPCDEIILLDRLRKSAQEEDVGGIGGIYAIQSRVETPNHARYFAAMVKDCHLHRQLIHGCRQVMERSYELADDPRVLAASMEDQIRAISDSSGAIQDSVQSAGSIVELARRNLMERLNHPEQQSRNTVPTHLTSLNSVLLADGFEDGQLIILAARPSVGKSAFAGNIAEFASVNCSMPGIIFSFEMTSEQWINRIACSRASVDAKRLQKGIMSQDDQRRLDEAYRAIAGADLSIDEAASQTIFDVRRKCHQHAQRLKRQGKRLRFVVIDYLQLISPTDPKRNRDEQIGEISRNSKQMAKDLGCPVIVLSQLNRDAANSRPMLHQLRESGNIEQDADTVMLLHRHDVNRHDESIAPDRDDIDVIVAKQRNGPIDDVPTSFVRKYTRFEDR